MLLPPLVKRVRRVYSPDLSSLLRRRLHTPFDDPRPAMKKSRSVFCAHVGSETPPKPLPVLPPTGLVPTREEERLLDVVRATCAHFGLKTVPRVAGGWVRDKLLERESHDIDIALDDCSGEEFATKVNEYLASQGCEIKSVGVVRANPDQSKHLATAMVKIFGQEVDFVNLRSEVYEGDSRIPKIEIGTPLEDAHRRDFTVNSMFYNVLTREVEDLTGRGLSDLTLGLLRTPLAAGVTFHDDPLRMLRGIRFASRYGFRLDEELCAALASERNAVALQNKVSSERVGIELEKALRGPHPKLALELLIRHNLADAAFKVPPERFDGENDRPQLPQRVDWFTSLRIVEALWIREQRLHEDQFKRNDTAPERDPCALYLAATLFPLGLSQFAGPKKGKKESVVKHIVLNSIKLSKKMSDDVYDVVNAATQFCEILDRPEASSSDKLVIGRLLFEVKGSWVDGLQVAVAVLRAGRAFSRDEAEYCERVEVRARQVVERICGPGQWELDQIWERLEKDPVLDGKELMAFLQIKGAQVSKAVALVRDFAFESGPPAKDESREAYVARAQAYIKGKWS